LPKWQRGGNNRKSKARPRQKQKTGSSEVLLPQRSPGFLAVLPISPHADSPSVLSVRWRFISTRPLSDSTEIRQVEQYVGTGQLDRCQPVLRLPGAASAQAATLGESSRSSAPPPISSPDEARCGNPFPGRIRRLIGLPSARGPSATGACTLRLASGSSRTKTARWS
jgi:hypothetical protein